MIKGQFHGFNHIDYRRRLADFINYEIKHYHHSPLQLALDARISERTLRKVRKGDPSVKYETFLDVIEVLAINHCYCNDDVNKKMDLCTIGLFL